MAVKPKEPAKKAAKKATGKAATVVDKKDNLPAVIDFAGDAGAGMEGADSDSFAIPFLAVVQKMGPQVDREDAGHVDGAEAGMLINSVTNELWDGEEGVRFIPCAFKREFIRWGARKLGGGFKGAMSPAAAQALIESGQIIAMDGGQLLCPTEHGVVDEKVSDIVRDTRNHFGLLETDDGWTEVLMSLTSTQIKKSKGLMSMLKQVKVKGMNPPTYYNVIEIVSVPESNDQGSWHGVKIALDGTVEDCEDAGQLYAQARSFWESVASKKVNVNYNQQDGGNSAGADEDDDSGLE